MRMLLVAALLALAGAPPPPQVLRVFPADGATVRETTAVGAELDFTRGEPVDPASLRLILDGVDVTGQARVTQTRDWPPSFVSITHTPPALAPGTHRVEVAFRTARGAAAGHAWTFALRPP